MAITNALITGKVVIPGTTIGVRAELTATPLTQNGALKWVADGTLSWGPASVETGDDGVIPAPGLKIPLGSSLGAEVHWRIVARPVDRKDLKPWTLGTFPITAGANLASLVSVDVITYTPAQVAGFQAMVNAAAADATAAAASATAADGWAEAALDSAADADAAADQAAASETAAETAASTATTQAGTATTAAGTATGAAATATTKAADAETARTAAVTARTAAETARTGAELAETNAETARAGAELAEANASAIAGADTADDLITVLDANPASDFRVQQDSRLSATIATEINESTPTAAVARTLGWAFVTDPEYGAVGDDATDDTAAFVAALADNVGRPVYVPALHYKIASATRLPIAGVGSALFGDDSGVGARLNFTHASGGIDIGDGTNNTYENRLANLVLNGTMVATKIVRCRRVYEPHFVSMRIEQAAVGAGNSLIELDSCGQFDGDRLTLANAPVGICTKGDPSPVANIRLANFYNLDEVLRISGSGARFRCEGWAEDCDVIVTLNRPGANISIGSLVFRMDILKTSGDLRLLRADASAGVNSQIVDFSECYVDAPGSTSPLIDFTGLDNSSSTFRCRIRDATVFDANPGAMIQTHPSQAWNLFLTDVQRIQNVPPGKWSGNPFATGGTWPAPPRLEGFGSPAGAVAAPIGSTWIGVDGASASFWVKESGGNTTSGWVAK